MIEIPSEALLEVWEMVSDNVPSSKKNDMAMRFLKIFTDHDVDLDDLSDLKGEDEHIDHAFDQLEGDSEDFDDFGESEEYED